MFKQNIERSKEDRLRTIKFYIWKRDLRNYLNQFYYLTNGKTEVRTRKIQNRFHFR